MVAVATFRSLFLEYSDPTAFPDTQLDTFIQLAASISSQTPGAFFPNQTVVDNATAYLAAHLLTLSLSSKAGLASSVSAGQVSTTYATPRLEGYAQTSYGLIYEEMLRTYGAGQRRCMYV